MTLQLIDINEEMIYWWNEYFKNCSNVTIQQGSIFNTPTNCIVSHTNSYGFMDGSLDLIISKTLGWHLQKKIQNIIKNEYNSELLVGQAILIETGNENIKYLISAPTMRVPSNIQNTVNVYLANRTIFLLLKTNNINLVSMSGMGTGVGKLSYKSCAKQMKKAYDDCWLNKYEFPETWFIATTKHQNLT